MYPRFIYTHFFTASHIVVMDDDPGIELPGVYTNMITGQAEDITVYCTFAQLNDMLYCQGNDREEVMHELSEIVGCNTPAPYTMDVTGSGGLECDTLLYCMERLVEWNEEENGQPIVPKYLLLAFIPKEGIHFNEQVFTADLQTRERYYLLLLTVRYRFYLHFIKEHVLPANALQYASLHDPLVFELARIQYEMMQGGR